MRWRRTARGPSKKPTPNAFDRRFELPETMPDEFAWDLHPSARAAAARGRIMMDEKKGRVTPQWVVDLAEERYRS
jgi:hypothetical protein